MDKVLRNFYKLNSMISLRNIHSAFIIFILFLLSCGGTESKQNKVALQPGFYNVEPTEFMAKYNSAENPVMIDVRTENEYKAGALVPEAINIDYHSDKFIQDMVILDNKAPTFVYCYSGGRSSKAIYKMKQLGFNHIYELTGGYDLWKRQQKK